MLLETWSPNIKSFSMRIKRGQDGGRKGCTPPRAQRRARAGGRAVTAWRWAVITPSCVRPHAVRSCGGEGGVIFPHSWARFPICWHGAFPSGLCAHRMLTPPTAPPSRRHLAARRRPERALTLFTPFTRHASSRLAGSRSVELQSRAS